MFDSHGWIGQLAPVHHHRELESLEIHRQVARRLDEDPGPVLTRARENVGRWISSRPTDALSGVFSEWEEILAAFSLKDLAAFIVSNDANAVRLRQSSPFAGVLSPREVWDIKRGRRRATA